MTEPDVQQLLIDMVRQHGHGVVATVSPGGLPEAAYVGLVATDDGVLLFTSSEDARKMENLRAQPEIAVVVGGDEGASVQVEGEAHVTEGEERERLAATFLAEQPRSRADQPGIALVAVRPRWARLCDTRTTPRTQVQVRLPAEDRS